MVMPVKHAKERSPTTIVPSKILKKRTQPLTVGEHETSTKGIYVIRSKKKKKKVYVGKSENVERRIKEHESYVKNEKNKGAGRFIDKIEDMEYCIIEFPENLDSEVSLRYYEQELIDLLKDDNYDYDVKNMRAAMAKKKFKECKEYIAKKRE